MSVPQVLTANRLSRGDVVYWNGQRGWVTRLDEAEILPDAGAAAILEQALEWVRRREVVGPYLFDVEIAAGKPVPVKVREVIRARGPSVRRDLGKQAG